MKVCYCYAVATVLLEAVFSIFLFYCARSPTHTDKESRTMSRPPTPRTRREVRRCLSCDFSLFIHAPNGPDVQLQTLELCVSFFLLPAYQLLQVMAPCWQCKHFAAACKFLFVCLVATVAGEETYRETWSQLDLNRVISRFWKRTMFGTISKLIICSRLREG